MSVQISIQLSEAEADAVLRSEGFSNGWGVRRSHALIRAQGKIIGAVVGAKQTAKEQAA